MFLLTNLLAFAGRNKRYVPPKSIKSFAGLGVSFYIALPQACTYLGSIYDVMRHDSGGQHIKLSHQAIRDLQWWLQPSLATTQWVYIPARCQFQTSDRLDVGILVYKSVTTVGRITDFVVVRRTVTAILVYI